MSPLTRPDEPAWMRLHRRYLDARGGAIAVITALFDGAWLGILDQPQFDQLDEAFYAGRAHFEVDGQAHSYRNDEVTRSGLHDWERDAIDGSFPPGGRISITGAGGGREVLALLECGYDAVGYEPNRALVEAGGSLLESLGHSRRLHASHRDAFPADVARCDGVVIGWGSYTHVCGRARRIALLKGARASLDEGAPLLVSFLLREERRYFRMAAGVANAIRRLRRAEPVEEGDYLRSTLFHLFTREEIESELADAGFRVESFESDPYGHALARAM